MPIFEFQCEMCSHSFEKLIFAGDEEYVVCPECGAPKVKKLLSSTSVVGSGKGLGGLCGTGGGKFS